MFCCFESNDKDNLILSICFMEYLSNFYTVGITNYPYATYLFFLK